MDELDRFTNPDDGYGLKCWRNPRRSRLLRRLKTLRPPVSIPPLRAFRILRDYFGPRIEELPANELEYGYQRLLVLDWITAFRVLRCFSEVEVRAHANLNGPPAESVLGHYWHGLLEGTPLVEIERRLPRRPKAPERRIYVNPAKAFPL